MFACSLQQIEFLSPADGRPTVVQLLTGSELRSTPRFGVAALHQVEQFARAPAGVCLAEPHQLLHDRRIRLSGAAVRPPG